MVVQKPFPRRWIGVPFTSLSVSGSPDFDIQPAGTQVRDKARAKHFKVGWNCRTSFSHPTLLTLSASVSYHVQEQPEEWHEMRQTGSIAHSRKLSKKVPTWQRQSARVLQHVPSAPCLSLSLSLSLSGSPSLCLSLSAWLARSLRHMCVPNQS